ncbi:hypothetical protein [Draconibacterium halophilum]|uniref:Uncharacterized protein n=1 Tax=Draconibacterium halophilum TaxID=2706887 RepID=A0A6C0RA47_9BACT|nr:hypothetical protein [Draconibacterium halophilum]QIA06625.1 hypothetical protein G0Q07_02265 [Draconibacterium halophilum]
MKTKIKQVTAATVIVLSLMVFGINATATKLTVCETVDSSLQLEDWMTDETIWSTANKNAFVQETDASMEIEDWMTNDEIRNENYSFVTETESCLEIENWMISKNTCLVVEKAIEPALPLENWMIDAGNRDVNDSMKGSELAFEIPTTE